MDRTRLKELLEMAGIPRKEFASEMGITEMFVSYLLSGERKIKTPFAEKAEPYLLKKIEERISRARFIIEQLPEPPALAGVQE